ncbi:M28 family metallopeptidase [Saccharopolyspora flava]|uniref:Aminopeptidase Y. Metallo peptidase. MEROPS family M28A n=1 Tax=Saccharopolyspora flava TaxID=95161 RepID=A0A1I6UQA1_9PSEU|nr:M28 family metallopeptidase [Saccharopolyspora flava]SFT03642.1 aminopeptidase Y . Metallo peptidase. MEROPS family M28A [Saccharopolyspora flava]
MSSRTITPRRTAAALAATCAAALVAIAPASAAPAGLGDRVTGDAVNRHLVALQRIADLNDGNRASGLPGYEASVDYVAGKLRGAGFDVTTPEFTYDAFYLDSFSLAVAGQPTEGDALEYSPATPQGGITAPLSVAAVDDTPGCEATDFGPDVAGSVALIQRGSCTFAEKQQVAADAGAVGVIIYNNVEGPLNGTLGDPADARIPSAGTSMQVGQALAGQAGAEVKLDVQSRLETVTTRNVVAQTRTGRPDNVVMAGAHLDSVPEGPGINDNGSGSAGLLETALRMGGSPQSENAVRFAWWGAEESGLVGSTKYVQSLTFEQQLDIALYLNFDMIGSPNAAYLAYDGDDSDGVGSGPGPQGSGQIEQDLTAAMAAQGVELEGTDFDGRSDYGEFIANGIPAGGLFTGAEEVKTEAQAAKWGGTAGVAFDPNYHQPGDHLGNIDHVALERNAKGLANVIEAYSHSTEAVNGMQTREQRAALRQSQLSTFAEHARGTAVPHGHNAI